MLLTCNYVTYLYNWVTYLFRCVTWAPARLGTLWWRYIGRATWRTAITSCTSLLLHVFSMAEASAPQTASTPGTSRWVDLGCQRHFLLHGHVMTTDQSVLYCTSSSSSFSVFLYLRLKTDNNLSGTQVGVQLRRDGRPGMHESLVIIG